ncbi:Maf family protein, partial [Streptomyces sp. NPDC056002]|uniref:Maf family protein n=1 Tax=Streptomyces sp. NPDC056002 TaxID=3345675 RepID=UPI0035D7EDBE
MDRPAWRSAPGRPRSVGGGLRCRRGRRDGVVGRLATAKADEVFAHLPAAVASDCVVIGCDSMLLLDGQLCGKPGDVDTARKQWQAMSGRTAQLHSGHAVLVVRDGAVTHRLADTGVTAVHFGSP